MPPVQSGEVSVVAAPPVQNVTAKSTVLFCGIGSISSTCAAFAETDAVQYRSSKL